MNRALKSRKLEAGDFDPKSSGSPPAANIAETGVAAGLAAPRSTPGETRLTAVIVACALFMQNLDSTVIATALPTIAHAFGSDPVRMNVALTSYLLSLTVFIPASGWVADRYGARTVFRAAIVVFTAGSVLCGLARNLPFMVGARVLQGMGGAMMIPVGRLVLLRTVAKTELVSAMAWLTIPALIGPVIGPPLGGVIVTYADWRWIFFINVPIGALGIVLVTLFVPDIREARPGRFDAMGLLLCGAALAGFMLGFETIGRGAVPLALSAGAIAAGLGAALAYAWHARRTSSPLLDLSLLRIPTFAVSIWSGSLFRIGIGAIPFLLPMMLQVGFGDTALRSGAITFASSAGALVMKPISPPAIRVLGFRGTLVVNGAMSAILLGVCALFRPGWPAAAIYGVLLVGGFFRSLQFTAYNTVAYADIPAQQMSAATSLYSTLQQLMLTLGIAAGAAFLDLSMALNRHPAPNEWDFRLAFAGVALISLFAAPVALAMPKDAGAELTGRG
ncbi:MAG: MFS transporter [Acetobacteraceae bacterium]|nr:MFS transporter [Acetobacteraceae bacterium]MBV8520931.1 MFS transporter [Acetobacteraceae bacterium]MBV8592624.1 MFS transporter [Acetobacteraceae bacterium]